jgi:hypothetical protein
MHKLVAALLKFLIDPLPLLWRVVRHPLSVHQWIGRTDIAAILGLMAWVGVIAVYAAGLLQPNFDLYHYGERG